MPALPDETAGQKTAWQLAPEDAEMGIVVGDFGRHLERLRAFKAVLDSGPATREWVKKGMTEAMLQIGFDPFDPEAWKRAGVDPNGPVGIFVAEKDRMQVVFRATDAQKAQATAQGWIDKSGNVQTKLACGAAGALEHCGSDVPWALASDPSHSLWARMEKDLVPEVRSMGTLAYAPLDVGPAKEFFDKPSSPVTGLHGAWFGTTAAPERVVTRVGVRADSAQKLVTYFTPRHASTLLGLGEGAISVWHATFSPDALWALAKAQAGPMLDQGTQLVLGMTGIDLDKDLVQNLSGEVLMASYRADRLDGGKPRALIDRAGAVFVLGTVDDAKSRKLADRLGELASGALGQFASDLQQLKIEMSYEKEAGAKADDRVVHWFKVTLPPEQAKIVGLPKAEMFITTIPGAIVIGEGHAALAELRKRFGKKPNAFLDGLPLAEERQRFERAPVAAWMSTGEAFSQRFDAAQEMPELATLFGVEAVKGFNEVMQLGQLLFDGSASFEVKDDRAELFYQLTFL